MGSGPKGIPVLAALCMTGRQRESGVFTVTPFLGLSIAYDEPHHVETAGVEDTAILRVYEIQKTNEIHALHFDSMLHGQRCCHFTDASANWLRWLVHMLKAALNCDNWQLHHFNVVS